MYQILDTNLFIGTIEDAILYMNDNWAVIHATQTVHYKVCGWDKKNNKPQFDNSNYIYYEKEDRLSLNWIDGSSQLYKHSGPETFINILDFIDKWIKKKKVCVHCDHGFSRSPTICLLYLSKRTNIISNESYKKAKADFLKIYPRYSPGKIANYIKKNWNQIN